MRPPVGLRGSLDPVGTGAEVDGVEVGLEDLVLGHLLLEAQGEHGLTGLALEAPLVREQRVLDQLLGDRRAALLDPAGRDVLDQSTGQGTGVDALVLVELGVLHGQDGLHHGLGDLVEGDGLTVLVTVQGGQQRTVGREDLGPHRVAVEGIEIERLRIA